MNKQISLTAILACIYCFGNAQWQHVDGYSINGNASSIVLINDTIIASFVSQTIAGIYWLANNGANWILSNNTSGLNDTRIRKFALYENATYAASDGDLSTGNVYVSGDHGISWTAAFSTGFTAG